MKKLVISFLLALPGLALAMSGSDIDFHGYMRAGGGFNSKGGDMTCVGNGTAGNEFRLGNECDNYGELALTFHHKKGKGEDSFFDSTIRMAYQQNGDANWESANPLFLREAFLEGGKFNGSPLTYWAGKRFYRENDLHMNDFYYYADTEPGFGGGVGAIPAGIGNLQIAYLQNTSSATMTTSGKHKLGMLDVRLKDVKITSDDILSFWGAYGWNTEGEELGTGKKLESSKGYALGAHHHHGLTSGFNHLAVFYGKGVMEGLNTYGPAKTSDSGATGVSVKKEEEKKSRIRVVEHLVFKPISKLDLAFSTTYENTDNGKTRNNKAVWYNYGVNPVYFFTDHYSLAAVLGQSVVDADGSPKKSLTRFTIAPQVTVDTGYWARPVIRAFYTRSFWNSANRGTIDSSGPYAKETALWNVGLQGEVWF